MEWLTDGGARGLAAWALCLVVAVAFAIGAVGKLRDPAEFTRTLRGLPSRLRIAVPVLEVLLAVGLAQPWRPLRDLTAIAGLGVLGGFSAYLAANPQLDDEGGCRCFGTIGAMATTTRLGIARNLGLGLALAVALALGPLGPPAVLVAVLVTGAGHLATHFLFTGPASAAAGRAGRAGHPHGPDQGLDLDPAEAFAPDLADPQRETMLVFLQPGCAACEQVRALLPGWQADPDGPRVLVVEDAATLDRFGVTVTPGAVVLDRSGRPVDADGRPSTARAAGAKAVQRRHRLAVQGHDLPIDPDAERTLLVFLRRGDPAPELPSSGLPVVVLSPHRLRLRLAVPVTHDPGNRVAELFGVTATPAAVLVDRRGDVVVALSRATDSETGLATLLQPPPA